jgi:acetolactate synthase-1/3 small subunit
MERQEYNITAYTENHIGLLNRIAIIFSRRKINIESLNTSPSEIEGIHRFNIVITETEEVVRKICRQMEKQVEVLKAYFNSNDEVVWQEMALYKVPTDVIAEKALVERLLRENGARAVVIRKDYTVFETTGHRQETDALLRALQPFGLIEFVRSARIAIIKASDGFNRQLREFEEEKPGEEVIENEFLNDRDGVFAM